MINILIRLHKGREKLFERCWESIINQTYKDYKVIVSVDHPSCISMLANKHLEFIMVTPQPEQGECFYNLYCNDLKQQVKEGWGFYLDSDDYLEENTSLENISKYLDEEKYKVVICQMSRSLGLVKPIDSQMDNRQIVSGKIGLPCIVFHHSTKDFVSFDTTNHADFSFIKEMKRLSDTKFIKQVLVHSPKRNFGR